ncbi:kinase-like domain-containing protein [Rhizophagus irregularis DAOM 181602=DAOM 197198]|nr:kinase-like domain-containing protein [Rhizophagus irregularis DAOM 181602=DAOM 197198]
MEEWNSTNEHNKLEERVKEFSLLDKEFTERLPSRVEDQNTSNKSVSDAKDRDDQEKFLKDDYGRRLGPHRRMTPFITRKIMSEKVRTLGDRKEGIEIYGDFVPFCKNPSSSETESSSSSESTRLHKLEKKPKMTITLICLVMGNTAARAFCVKISRDEPISELKYAIKAKKQNGFASVDVDKLKLWKISEYFPDLSAEECIHVIVKSPKSPLLSLEEVLSCIPPPARYPYDTRTSISSNRVAGAWPSRITRVEVVVDSNVKTAMETSLPSFESFSKEDLESQSFSGPLHDVIEQVYNYMSALQLQYGILSTYDYHWFFYRPKNNNTALHISHPLKRDSTDPPVLKAYAYLAQLAERDPTSPIII